MKFKLIRKRGGRSYTYSPGGNIPGGWQIQDEDGKVYETYEDYEKTLKPVKKVAAKKAVKEVKKED